MADSISLEQIQEQQGQLQQTVSSLVAQKATLEDQLEQCKATLASNQGALQYANALIQTIVGEQGAAQVGEGNVPQDIKVPTETPVEEAEVVTL